MAQTSSQDHDLSPKEKEVKPGEVSMLGRSVFLCSFCGKGYNTRRDLLVHQWTHKERQTFICQTCDKSFSNENMFRRHMSVHVREEKRFVSCEICKKVFRNNRNLEEHHLKAHMGQKPHECATCGAQFSWKENLAKHMRVHVDKPFACRICHEAFKDKTALRIHQRSHRLQVPTEKSLQDSKKNQAASSKNQNPDKSVEKNLMTSVMSQPSIKKSEDIATPIAVVKIPSKIFAKSGDGDADGNEDEDDKPFKCPKCGHAFVYKFSMEAHMKGHAESGTNSTLGVSSSAEGSDASTSDSSTKFPRNPVLEKPHKCHLCDETFRWPFCLDAHIKIHEQEEQRQLNGEEEPELTRTGRRKIKRSKVTHMVTVVDEPTRIVTIKKMKINENRPSKPVTLKRPQKQVDMMEKIKAEKAKNLGTLYEKTKTVNYLNKPKLNKNEDVDQVNNEKDKTSIKDEAEASPTKRRRGRPRKVDEIENIEEKNIEEELVVEKNGDVVSEEAEVISRDETTETEECTTEVPSVKCKVDCAIQVELDEVGEETAEKETSPVHNVSWKRTSDAFTQADEEEEEFEEEEFEDEEVEEEEEENVEEMKAEEEDEEEEIPLVHSTARPRRRKLMELDPRAPLEYVDSEEEHKDNNEDDDGTDVEEEIEETPDKGEEENGENVNEQENRPETETGKANQETVNLEEAVPLTEDNTNQVEENEGEKFDESFTAIKKSKKRKKGKSTHEPTKDEVSINKLEELGSVLEMPEQKPKKSRKRSQKTKEEKNILEDKLVDPALESSSPKRSKKAKKHRSGPVLDDEEVNGDHDHSPPKRSKKQKGNKRFSNKHLTAQEIEEADELVNKSVKPNTKRKLPKGHKSLFNMQMENDFIANIEEPSPKPSKVSKVKSKQSDSNPAEEHTDEFAELSVDLPDRRNENLLEKTHKKGKVKAKGRKLKEAKSDPKPNNKTVLDETEGPAFLAEESLKPDSKLPKKKHRKSSDKLKTTISSEIETRDEEVLAAVNALDAETEDQEKNNSSNSGKLNLKVRVFTCDTCGKAFMEKVALSAHKLLHIDEDTSMVQPVNPTGEPSPPVQSPPSPNKGSTPRSRKQKHPRKSPHKV